MEDPNKNLIPNQNLPPLNKPQNQPSNQPSNLQRPSIMPLSSELEKPVGRFEMLRRNKWAIWLIGISLFIILVVGFFVFRRQPAQLQPKIQLSIEAPDQLMSSKEAVYKIHVDNKDNVSIKNAVVDVIYPPGFTYTDSVPAASNYGGTEFKIPQVDPGQTPTIMIKGDMVGNAGEDKTISAILHYRFANFNSDFTIQAQATSRISNSNVTLQFDGPAQASDGQNLTYTLNYTNTTQSPIANLTIKVKLPAAFQASSYTPNPDLTNAWSVATLPANGSGTIQIYGSFKDTKSGDQEQLSAEVDGYDASNHMAILSSATYAVAMVPMPLSTTISLGSSSLNQNGAVDPGTNLSYTVKYANNSTISATGVIVSAVLKGDAYDYASIQASTASIAGNIITWDASQNSALSNVSPGGTGELTFSVTLKKPVTRGNETNITVSAGSTIKSVENQQAYESPPLTIKINTEPQVDTTLSYASGANPPVPGQPTTYLVVITLRNSTNDLKNVQLTMNLPHGQAFDTGSINSAEQGNIKYNQNTKLLTWNVGTLAAHTGDFKELRKLQFNVTVQPNITDSGRSIILVNNIKFVGTDAFTSKDFTQPQNDINTQNDPSGMGTVQ